MNFTYETLDLIDVPIIKVSNQTEPIHRIIVFLKCFMVFVLENKDLDVMILVHRLRSYLIYCYMAIAFVMIALSEELIRKAWPLMMFCYASQTLKLFDLDSDDRRTVCYIGFIFCCLEFTGFEFIYDVYIILCFLFKSLYSLSQYQDEDKRERGDIERLSCLLFFLTQVAMIANSHYVDYRIIIGVNSFMAISGNIKDKNVKCVTILYVLMTKLLYLELFFGYDLDGWFDEFLKWMWNCAIDFTLQFFR